MKKAFTFIVLFALLLALPACSRGAAPAEATPVPTDEGASGVDLQASATDTAANAASHEPPASSTDTNVQSDYATAQNYTGRSVQDLYAAIGQPTETSYGPSEDDEDAQEGMLFYNGFYVWTVRTDTGETVREVYLDE